MQTNSDEQSRGGALSGRRLLVALIAACIALAAVAPAASAAGSLDTAPSAAPAPAAAFGLTWDRDANSWDVNLRWDYTDPVDDPVTTIRLAITKHLRGTESHVVPLEWPYWPESLGLDDVITRWCVTLENAAGPGPEACSSEWITPGGTDMSCTSTSFPGVLRYGLLNLSASPSDVAKGSRYSSANRPGVLAVSPWILGQQITGLEDIDLHFPIPANATVVSASLSGTEADIASVAVANGKVTLHIDGPVASGSVIELPLVKVRLEATGEVGSSIQRLALRGTIPTDPAMSFTVLGALPVRANCVVTSEVYGRSTLVNPPTWSPFATADAFTTQQFADFSGRAPTTAERAAWATALVEGTTTRQDLVDQLRRGTYWEPVLAPVVRLYQAYFLRLPDTGGLTYWIARRRAGTSLNAISQAFASSNEFKTRYGNLSNVGFVLKVYENVLGRPGDAAGITFWTAQLDQRKRTRGTVMTGFSESGEHKRTTAGIVTTTTVTMGLLRRVPTPAEIALGDGQTAPAQIDTALGQAEYANRL